jgi:glyoxylase-like metal-dependent hydrolase (beta-lactamase superfamily II)
VIDLQDNGNGIITIDSGYMRPKLASIHLILENDRVAFVDTGTNDSYKNSMRALENLGLDETAVDFLLLTHIHLDHAGGAGKMMKAYPNARLVVHPRGVRHMIDPSKLIAGVEAVYGSEYVQKHYGEILPVDENRIIAATDGHEITLSGRKLRFLDTPGHARHHNSILDSRTRGIFTGDIFGLAYTELNVSGRQFLFPTSSPSQFDPQAMKDSITRLLGLNPPEMFLTHFGPLNDVAKNGRELLRRLEDMTNLALAERYSGTGRHELIKSSLTKYLIAELRAHSCNLSEHELIDILDGDIELNTQGLEIWLDTDKNQVFANIQ